MRVKTGVKARRRRNKVLKLAKGFRGRSKNTIRQATQRVEKSLQYAYRDRLNRKRDFRRLWISRINAAARINECSYSQLIDGLNKASVELDRKILADLGANEPEAFTEIAAIAKANSSSSAQGKSA